MMRQAVARITNDDAIFPVDSGLPNAPAWLSQ
jgi:hypothetical protein